MAIVVGGVSVDLEASAARFVGEMEKAARSTLAASQKMQANLTGVQTRFGALEGTVTKSLAGVRAGLGLLSSTLGILSAAVVTRAVIRYSDAWQSTGNQLRLVTRSADDLATTQERLFRIAQGNSAAFDATAQLYFRLAQASSELAGNSTRLANIVDLVEKAIRTGGSTADEASRGLLQFSQAAARGVLRGQDLISVMTQIPGLLNAIQEGLGITRGELLKQAEAGELTFDRIITALESQDAQIRKNAATITLTFGDAWAKLSNSIERFIGRTNEATGSINLLTLAMSGLATAVDATSTAFDIAAKGLADYLKTLFHFQSSAETNAQIFAQGVKGSNDFSDSLTRLANKAREVENATRDAAASAAQLGKTPPAVPPARPILGPPELKPREEATQAVLRARLETEAAAAAKARSFGSRVTTTQKLLAGPVGQATLTPRPEVASVEQGGAAAFAGDLEQLSQKGRQQELLNQQAEAADKAANAMKPLNEAMLEYSKSVSGTAGPIQGLIGLWARMEGQQVSQQDALASTVSFSESALQGLFGSSKAFAVAQSIINTALAVTRALSAAPPPFSFALAAAVGALGAAQTAAIAAEGFQTGGVFKRDQLILAGEAGPEIIATESGGRVLSHHDTVRALSNMSAGGNAADRSSGSGKVTQIFLPGDARPETIAWTIQQSRVLSQGDAIQVFARSPAARQQAGLALPAR